MRFEAQTCAGGNQVDLERLSFKGALDTLNHFADAVHSAHGKPRRQAELLDAMFELIVQDQLPIRPGRSEPAVWGATERNAELGIMFRYSRQP